MKSRRRGGSDTIGFSACRRPREMRSDTAVSTEVMVHVSNNGVDFSAEGMPSNTATSFEVVNVYND